jgi:lysylphosphatidylglycerol synthetase-like protein (DUF2156 family)
VVGTASDRWNATVIDVPVGRRVMVVSDLLLTPRPTPSSIALSTELASALDAWDGPGILIIAGNLFDLSGSAEPQVEGAQAMAAHPRLAEAFGRFLGTPERRVIRQPGTHEPGYDTHAGAAADMTAMGVEQLPVVDLHLHTTTGLRQVRVEPGEHAYAGDRVTSPVDPNRTNRTNRTDRTGRTGRTLGTGTGTGTEQDGQATARWRILAEQSEEDAPWLEGIGRLSDPSAVTRFVTSRVLYRRFGRYAWWLIVPFAVAGLLRVAITPWVLQHLGNGLPAKVVRHAHQADLVDQLMVAGAVAVLALLVLTVVLGPHSGWGWAIGGGGSLYSAQPEGAANDRARDAARQLLTEGYAGLITGATFHSELTNLGEGFYANVGATAEVVEEHRGRLGLPPVFVHRPRVSWIEVETGAELHARLLLAQTDLRSPSLVERLVILRRTVHVLHPAVVASYPHGDSWPPAPDLRQAHRKTKRVRRVAATGILVAGFLDVLDAITPPLRLRLHLLLEILPLRATVAAGALVALAGLALIGLGRGILRGQHLAWQVAVTLLSGTLVLHLVAGGDVEESLLALAILVVLVVNRREFTAASDWPSLRSAVVSLVLGAVAITVLATASVELFAHFTRHHLHFSIPWWTAWWAVAERLVGIKTVNLPPHLDRFLTPTLLVIGISLVVAALFLVSRPVVDRRLTSGRAAEFRARDIVRRHGSSTLDYFALRTDKQWFFHRDSLVAYAVYGGICLISPDPIGPLNEREQAWDAFRRFADGHGWVPAVMGAGEGWLPIYRESGMHNIYLGDEAVVDVQHFTLAGGDKKGLRQAHNRVAKKGYAATFHDPSRISKDLSEELVGLMGLSRRGEHERGFSMMLGRVFDPRDTGLLLTVVRGPDGRAAAMCQFVPAPGIKGFSLDLMRRDPGDHPNGLLDFALCSTIEHLRSEGHAGLSLNFAALRSTLAGEKGDGAMQRAERWFLKRLSSFAQIESLWLFNAKYGPDWLPRYVVFDTAEHLVPVVMAIFRAESLWEIPVLGKLLAVGAERRMLAAQQETEAFIAASFGDHTGEPGDEFGTDQLEIPAHH